MRATRLRTEYLKNPKGIDIREPRFSWNCRGGIRQSAYRIRAERDGALVWDSGRVESPEMARIRYEGEPLKSRDIVNWTVQLWDENGECEEMPPGASFEMGLLEDSDWQARWIGSPIPARKGVRYPVDCFRKIFSLPAAVKKARLYATARGVYDVSLDGKRIEAFILAPGMTDYRKRIQYQTCDVTELLQDGPGKTHTLDLRLADGWFRGSVAAYGVTEVFGRETSIMAQLELTLADDRRITIGTDADFRWSDEGPIRFADLKDGEIFDARRTPEFVIPARVVPAPRAEICASNNVPVVEHEHFKPALLTAKDGTPVLDFGQNIAGYPAFAIKGERGQRIRFVCGEVLDEDGRVDLRGIQETRPLKGWTQTRLIMKLMGKNPKGPLTATPKQEIELICSGDVDHYKTSFAVFGFRYMEILTTSPLAVNPEDFTAIAVYSDMEETGSFACSHEGVNRLFRNTLWSTKGNFLDVPTDCPTRERLGWTGDAQIFFNTAAYLFDTAAFFRKWLRDMEDNQYRNGLISAVIPYSGVEMMYRSTGMSVGWADAIYLIPYRYYLRYGDAELLRKCWPMIKRCADYLMGHTGLTDRRAARSCEFNRYTYEKGVHLGEWLEPEEFRDAVYGAQAKHPEECTAYFHLAMKTMGEIAELVGDSVYAFTLAKYAEGSRQAYNALFTRTGKLITDRQAKLVRPLALGLLEGEEKAEAEKRLLKAVKAYDYRVGTGFLSTPFLLPVLTEAGAVEAAYRVLTNPGTPGWLAEGDAGATTIWEDWEGRLSRNHYSPGAVTEWLFNTVGGIRCAGERHFIIAPRPDPGRSLTEAEVSWRSPSGEVRSAWKYRGRGAKKIVFEITVPANCTAEIHLPDGRREPVTAGSHQYVMDAD